MPKLTDVYISSTHQDLALYRTKVKEAVMRLGAHPITVEESEMSLQLAYDRVQQAEAFIGIYAYRYGFVPGADMTYRTKSGAIQAGNSATSLIEWEYHWAKALGIPLLLYLISATDGEGVPLSWPYFDGEPNQTRLNNFKRKLPNVSSFYSPYHLQVQVTNALSKVISEPAPENALWESGARFDHYTLRALIGAGGNGEVWRADENLPDGSTREVAIKVLRADMNRDEVRVERFRRELGVVARLDHGHIVKVFTYGERGGQQYVVMPYLTGGTLRSRISGKAFALETTLRWLEQIGGALDYAHDRNLIHRDVKPENMLLAGNDEDMLYLADFGLVVSLGQTDHDHLTNEGKPAGTGRYMAPEQWRSQTLSRQTDLYALAILAYELLTGHLPFNAKSDYELGEAHCGQDLPEDARLSPEILHILRKAAAKIPTDRYATARAFLTDLRNWEIDPANLEPRIGDYLKWVTVDLYESVRAQFVELTGTAAVLRVAVLATQWPDEDDLFARASAAIHADHIGRTSSDKTFVADVREHLVALDRAVLVGEPGSGKSWMLRRLQADYARAWLEGRSEGRRLIPVLIKLNEYEGGSFADFVKSALDTLAPYYERLVREKRLVLLCDALNEMPRGAGQMLELIQYLQNAPYFVVSCRVRDYRDDLNDLKPLEQVWLRDLDLPAIHELIHKRLPEGMGDALWTAMGGSESLLDFWKQTQTAGIEPLFWDAKTEWWRHRDFYGTPRDWRAMHDNPARLIPLCRSPYLGDLLCRTYREDGSLAASRAELFGKFVEQMIDREAKAAERRGEGEHFPTSAAIEAALVAVAHALQESKRTTLSPDEARKAVNRSDTDTLLKAAADANILGAEGDSLKFAHQLLQEYFAARILQQALDANQSAAPFFAADWWDAGVWRETTVILGEGAQGANRVARWIAPVSPEAALQVITRSNAGLSLDEVDVETRAVLIASAKAKTSEIDPRGRAAAYRVLGLFGADDRPGIGVFSAAIDGATFALPDLVWADEVSAGDYWIGGDEETYQAIEAREVSIHQPFRAAKYLITYQQFQTFIDAGVQNYLNPTWWEGLSADDDDKTPAEQKHKYANHPRDTVSWYEAVAFCRWLTAQYRAVGRIDAETEISLPTEYEWEVTARGRDRRVYPYGSVFDATKGNTSETGIRQTSAVGILRDENSPYGGQDLSGNVWEWCLNKVDSPEDVDLSGTAVRVLRGGSWDDRQAFARAAYRYFSDPFIRNLVIGFRVVQRRLAP